MNLAEANTLIIQAFAKHNLFSKGWSFEWDNAKTRFGCCRYSRKLITMSSILVELNSELEVRDTILHEIAHALVGPAHWHNDIWKAKAAQIGAQPVRAISSDDVKKPAGKYIGRCVGCGLEEYRYRKIKPGEYEHTDCKRLGREAKIEWRKA